MKKRLYICCECQITWGEIEDANSHYEKTKHKWKSMEEKEGVDGQGKPGGADTFKFI